MRAADMAAMLFHLHHLEPGAAELANSLCQLMHGGPTQKQPRQDLALSCKVAKL